MTWLFWRIRKERLEIKTWQLFFKGIISFKEISSLKNGKILQSFRSLTYQMVVLLFLLLAASGFLPIIIIGGHLSGVLLIIHLIVAPVFCVLYALSIILWVNTQRFHGEDWTYLVSLKGIRKNNNKVGSVLTKMFWQKIYFWLFMLASLPAIMAIILSMYPFFGTTDNEFLMQLHRYSTLIMFIVFSLHILTLSDTSDTTKNKRKIQ